MFTILVFFVVLLTLAVFGMLAKYFYVANNSQVVQNIANPFGVYTLTTIP